MLINEFAQWAAIVFLGIVCLGLTRQLGHFLISRREQLETEGPDLGRNLPTLLFRGAEVLDVERLVRQSPSGVAGIMVMSDNCYGCGESLQILDEKGPIPGVPLIAVISSETQAFDDRVEARFDYVTRDPGLERAGRVGIHATPFLILIDGEFTVLAKSIQADPHDLVGRWREERRAASLSSRDGESVVTSEQPETEEVPA